MDNIGVFDRRYLLPDGSKIEQSDGTAWMAMFSPQHACNVALELATERPPTKTSPISSSTISSIWRPPSMPRAPAASRFGMTRMDSTTMCSADRTARSITCGPAQWSGLPHSSPSRVSSTDMAKQFPSCASASSGFAITVRICSTQLHHIGVEVQGRRPGLAGSTGTTCAGSASGSSTRANFCRRMASERSPATTSITRIRFTEARRNRNASPTAPADSPVAMFGGNSNWRGPVWMPMNYLLIEALQKFGFYFGDTFKVEFPTGSGQQMNLWDISLELQRRARFDCSSAVLTAGDPSTEKTNSSRMIRTGATTSSSTSTSTATMAPGSGASHQNRLDRPDRKDDPAAPDVRAR